MKSKARNKSNGIVQLTRDEIVGCLESEAKRRFHLSARTLLRRAKRGQLKDRGAAADLLSLSQLLRKNDRIFAE